ncbi:MAG TPA: efflux RND transporter periplasmic adaptor subunit, partial [Usitatibacter sp.]|nr:efflux RND transporter periplasmic adaptor subunit [Usitatibacter sp.]
MNKRILAMASLAVIALAASGFGFWWLGMSQGMKMAAGDSAPADASSGGKRVLYWHDPMVPGPKFDKPGKSPFMDMQLVPVYADSAAGSGVSVDPRLQQSLGMRTAPVVEVDLAPRIEAVGSVAWNERDVALVQARANGYVEKLHVRAPLDPVRRGEPLADLYVPEWVAAQEEFLAIARMQGPGVESLRDAAIQRMRLAGMSQEQILGVQSEHKVRPRLAVVAPISGVVAELGAREGMTVAPGALLFRINGLATVWVNAEVPEGVAAQVRPGNPVEARAAALPEERFKGRVSAVLPEVNSVTRTLKVRIELANPSAKLVPGMFATIDFAPGAARKVLAVPTESVIRTGERSVVMVAEGDKEGRRFHPAGVETGVESKGMTEIRKGLEKGQVVVTSGQFLIDSEASLKAAA